ncbi:MAG TPA: cyclic nucleotide-binding domain-containing protein [Candidatus Obscuribacterales bacterium]
MKPIFSLMLSSQDYEVVRMLYKWLDCQEVSLHFSLLEELGYNNLISATTAHPLLESEDANVRGAAIVVSLNDWSLKSRSHALQHLDRMLQGTEAEQQAAIRALGRSRQTRYTNLLLPYLSHSATSLRREALDAIRYLADQESSRLLQPLLQAIRVGTADERCLAMESLIKINDSSCVSPLLTLSQHLTPVEKRQAEDVVLQIGLKAIPAAIAIFQDAGQPYDARSMAARAISRLAFAQFEAIFPRLITTEIEQAYRFLHHQAILQTTQDQRPGATVLTLMYQDGRETAVSFILEMLTLGGRLPDFELLRASLRSDNLKERGNAIETIEQGVSRTIFQALLPLLDSRNFRDRLHRVGRDQPYHSAEEVLHQSLNSTHELERAAAVQAIWDQQDNASDRLRQMLHQSAQSGMVRDTVMALLFRSAPSETQIPDQLNLIERIAQLSRGRFFAALSIRELEAIARDATEVRYTNTLLYQLGDPADHVYYIVSGTVYLDTGDRIEGDWFGEDGLYGQRDRTHAAKTQYLHALVISASALLRAAETYPNIAIKLLETKLTVPPHAKR